MNEIEKIIDDFILLFLWKYVKKQTKARKEFLYGEDLDD